MRIDHDLYAFAQAAAALVGRSLGQQIEYWARIGREVEMSRSVSPRAIASVLARQADYDALDATEQAIVRAEWSQRSFQLRSRLDFARDFSAAGQAYSEVDGRGQVVRRQPRAEP